MMTYNDEISMFDQITKDMAETFARKRQDYGASTTETWLKFGPVSMCTRMHDKMNRIDNLLISRKDAAVKDEKIEDTLLDLANYAIIAIIELAKERERFKLLNSQKKGEVKDKDE